MFRGEADSPVQSRKAADGAAAEAIGPRNRGFSLIELLVVIAVIAVLLAVLAPSLKRAADSARAAICMSNLHQQATAVRSYLVAHRGIFPDHRTDSHTGSESDRYWATTLLRYGATKDVFLCAGIGESQTDYGTTWSWKFDQYNIGYGYNGWFLGIRLYVDQSCAGIATKGYFKLSQIRVPSMNILIGDTNPPWGQSLWWPASGSPFPQGLNDARHHSGGGLVFNDSHAELRKADTVNPPGAPATQGDLTFVELWDPRQGR